MIEATEVRGRMRPADWRLLLRPPLLIMVAASTLVGGLLGPGSVWGPRLLGAVVGVLFLSAGATVINQVQERGVDALMLRTRQRPLVTGRLGTGQALVLAGSSVVVGLMLLLLSDGRAALAGLTALVWYNLIYTPLKLRTPWAVLPGAVSGGLPPLIGWLAVGSPLVHPHILLLVALLVLWQVPHFLLLVQRYRDDYRRAGFPVLADQLGCAGIRRVISCWSCAVVFLAVALALWGPLHGEVARILLPAAGSWVIFGLLRLPRGEFGWAHFRRINMFLGLVFFSILLERIAPF